MLLASEESIEAATRNLIFNAKLLVEPSGAVPLAAITEHHEKFQGLRVGVVISGGNIDPQSLIRLSAVA